MARRVRHNLLTTAKLNKKDEFHTLLIDIENELKYYTKAFENKVVYCNCDNPYQSNFFRYFAMNFNALKLKKLICTSYDYTSPAIDELDLFQEKRDKKAYKVEITHITASEDIDTLLKQKGVITILKGNGDFRSKECIELLKGCDIVVTNPPFSLFREYIDLVVKYKKQFLVIGNINAITYKNVFSLIKDNKAWLGVNLGRGISGFIVPKEYELYGTEARIDENENRLISPNNCLWLTNLHNENRNMTIPLEKKHEGHEIDYPKYDNFNGINVNYTKDIPMDYLGFMGVPITFLHKFNPNQFEIIRFRKGEDDKDLRINGKCPYFRIIIKRKQSSLS